MSFDAEWNYSNRVSSSGSVTNLGINSYSLFYEEPPDYSDNPAAPQQLQLVANVAGYELNLVNAVGGADRADYVRFSVPEGQRLSTFELRHYSSTDNVAFIAIQLGSSITATAQNPAPLKGYSHFGPGQVGSNLINALGGPLEAGEYSVWIQQIGAKTDYSFSLQTVPAPVPTPVLNPSYSLSAFASSVNEGSTASFTLSTSNVAAGTALSYVISGVQAADIVGGQLTGSVNVGSNGQATISIPIAADNLTEGPETMTVTVRSPQGADVASANVTINDTSRSQPISNSREFIAGVGDEIFQGATDQLDIVRVTGSFRDFQIQKTGATTVVTDRVGSNGRDTLVNIERIKFSDKAVALDTEAVGGQAYRVYKAAFNREPDQGGLGYWIAQMDSGMTLIEAAARFIDSNEFRAMYGTSPTDEQYLTKVYQNVLGRDPEPAGYNWWLNEIRTNPEKTRAKVLADFSESVENNAGTAQLVGQGIIYEPWVGS